MGRRRLIAAAPKEAPFARCAATAEKISGSDAVKRAHETVAERFADDHCLPLGVARLLGQTAKVRLRRVARQQRGLPGSVSPIGDRERSPVNTTVPTPRHATQRGLASSQKPARAACVAAAARGRTYSGGSQVVPSILKNSSPLGQTCAVKFTDPTVPRRPR